MKPFINSLLCLTLLSGCAIQGGDSFTPTGITLNRSVRLGLDAFKPNPFEKPADPPPPPPLPPPMIEPAPEIHHHHYAAAPRPRYSFQTFEPRQTDIVILESYE